MKIEFLQTSKALERLKVFKFGKLDYFEEFWEFNKKASRQPQIRLRPHFERIRLNKDL